MTSLLAHKAVSLHGGRCLGYARVQLAASLKAICSGGNSGGTFRRYIAKYSLFSEF